MHYFIANRPALVCVCVALQLPAVAGSMKVWLLQMQGRKYSLSRAFNVVIEPSRTSAGCWPGCAEGA
jgi:hypothetical protein